jgi:tetratricopeptide (TPR) repeat protein
VKKSEILAEEQRAIDLEESGDEPAALEVWLRLAQARPMAGFYCRAGRVLQSLGRYGEAESAFRSARELNPNMALASIGLASTLIQERKFAEAIDVLDPLIAQEESALAYDLRGNALMDLERYEQALESFRKAVALDPSYEEAFYNIGWLLRNTDEVGAQSAFAKALELDNSHASAHRELGWILRKAKQLDLAELHLRQATQLNPADAWAWVYLGNLLWGKGEFSAAEDAIKQAYEQAPNEWYPNWELASFYEDGGNQEKAARFYHRALLASPDEPVLLFSYGRFLFRQGDCEGAKKYLQRACEVDPGYDEARQLLRALASGNSLGSS